jgi:hypothetical protein
MEYSVSSAPRPGSALDTRRSKTRKRPSQLEIQEIEDPERAHSDTSVIRCTQCGKPAAATEYFNLGKKLEKQEQLLCVLASSLDHLESTLSKLARALGS